MPKASSMTLRIGQTELPGTPEAHQFVGADHGDVPVSFFLMHSPPRARVELHAHPYPEVFILQAGRATFEVDETEITARPGEIVIAPAGAPHRFANTGAEELRLTAIHPAAEVTTQWLSRPRLKERRTEMSPTRQSLRRRHGPRSSLPWTLAIVSLGLLMTTLDNLVVTTALPSIRRSLGASIQSLEWTVNAYTLTFAVLLLTGAALGDRLGRRRMFAIGLSIFTVASAGAALSATTDALIAARALQGLGAAIVLPLTLTLLSEKVPPARRGMALGIWGGVSGLGVAIGPLVGGAVVSGISWHWIFWINVPVGVVLVPLALTRLGESRGPSARLDLCGLALAAPGLLGITYAAIRGQALGWTSATIQASLAVGIAFVIAFVAWELRAPEPMLPMRFFRSRAFAATNGLSFAMYFGVFGSIFLLAQFFQTTQGYTPLQAGLRTLPWTGMPMIVAPIAGILSDRIGPRPLMTAGLALQASAIAWLGAILTPDVAYGRLIVPFMLAGAGMALVFAPSANAVLSSVRPWEAGQASGATNAIRELGGVIGVAVLASVFSSHGSYTSPQAYTAGLTAAIPIGAVVLAIGAVLALIVPTTTPAPERQEDRPAQTAAIAESPISA